MYPILSYPFPFSCHLILFGGPFTLATPRAIGLFFSGLAMALLNAAADGEYKLMLPLHLTIFTQV
jgi:hypothetical protein